MSNFGPLQHVQVMNVNLLFSWIFTNFIKFYHWVQMHPIPIFWRVMGCDSDFIEQQYYIWGGKVLNSIAVFHFPVENGIQLFHLLPPLPRFYNFTGFIWASFQWIKIALTINRLFIKRNKHKLNGLASLNHKNSVKKWRTHLLLGRIQTKLGGWLLPSCTHPPEAVELIWLAEKDHVMGLSSKSAHSRQWWHSFSNMIHKPRPLAMLQKTSISRYSTRLIRS